MTLPTKGNLPIQQRAGYNQGPQALTLIQAKYVGQPAIPCGVGDTVIFRNSPAVPGESNPRALGMYPGTVSGLLFNGTGGDITYALILIDDQGNEFSVVAPGSISDGNYEYIDVVAIANEVGLFCMPPGWSLVVRVSLGNPTAGKGFMVLPWAYDVGRNLVSIVEPITTAGLVKGPPKGRAWQICGSVIGQVAGGSIAMYLNFDSVQRTVQEEILILAGEEFLVNNNSGPIAIASGESVTALEDLTSNPSKGLILSYPDKLKFVALENQASAPLYVNINFAEFDLPRDMG